THMAADLDAELAQEHFAQTTSSHPRGRFARAGTFEHVADVAQAVLDDAGQVGVTGAQSGYGWGRIGDRFDIHLALPVRPVFVVDHHGDGSAHGHAVPHAGHDFDAVMLDLLSPAAAVALLPARQVDVDILGEHGQSGW